LLVAIVVDAHHQSSSEADECDNRSEGGAIGPKIHDADFGLSGAMRGFDRGFERDPLLEEVEVTVAWGNGIEVLVGGSELNSFACKGVEGFEEEVLPLRGQGFSITAGEPVVEEDGFWD
jgi:hypothetical protein